LKPSEDLGFSETGGLYLPAIERYNGRFYTSLESGKTKIIESPHHFLIISGLYGLLLAEEPTQLYSVPIEWGCNVQCAWMDNNSITQIFIDYLEENKIQRIFDFIARDDYRDLINWDRVKTETGVTVLHAMSTEGAGNNALNSFGEYLGESDILIQPSERLLTRSPDKDPNTHKGNIYFTDTPEPWDKYPKERNKFLPGEGILYYSHIPDTEVYGIFKTAEKLTQLIYNHDKNLEDAGSIGFNEYAKGYEVMLDIKVRKPIQKYIHTKYPSLVQKKRELCEQRIKEKILDSYSKKTISLGEWEYFEQNLKKCSEIGEKIQEFIQKNWGNSFYKLIKIASNLVDDRNDSSHREIQSMAKFLMSRKEIVRDLNEAIIILYGDASLENFRLWQMKYEEDDSVKLKAVEYISQLGKSQYFKPLTKLLDNNHKKIRETALKGMKMIDHDKTIQILQEMKEDATSPYNSEFARKALETM